MAADDLDRVLRHLLSPPGKHAAADVAWRLRLPTHLVDDVVSRAAQRALNAVETTGTIENVGGFARRLLIRATQDLLRAKARDERHLRRLGISTVMDASTGIEVAEAPGVPADDGRFGVAARRAVMLQASRSVPAAAAALTFLSIRYDDAVAADDCPQPAGGVGPVEAATWAGLWYAGQRECFPAAGGADDAATRKRRERASRKVRALLSDAVAAVV